MKWVNLHLKQMQYAWYSYWLRREYEQRLTKASVDRWVNSKRGLITREREIIHEWYAKEHSKLYEKYIK